MSAEAYPLSEASPLLQSPSMNTPHPSGGTPTLPNPTVPLSSNPNPAPTTVPPPDRDAGSGFVDYADTPMPAPATVNRTNSEDLRNPLGDLPAFMGFTTFFFCSLISVVIQFGQETGNAFATANDFINSLGGAVLAVAALVVPLSFLLIIGVLMMMTMFPRLLTVVGIAIAGTISIVVNFVTVITPNSCRIGQMSRFAALMVLFETLLFLPWVFLRRERLLATARVYGKIYQIFLTSPGVLLTTFIVRIMWALYFIWIALLVLYLALRILTTLSEANDETNENCHFSLFSPVPPILLFISLLWGSAGLGSFDEVVVTHVVIARLRDPTSRLCSGWHSLHALRCAFSLLGTIFLNAFVYCEVKCRLIFNLVTNFPVVLRTLLTPPRQKLNAEDIGLRAQLGMVASSIPLGAFSSSVGSGCPCSCCSVDCLKTTLKRVIQLFESFNFYTLPFSVANNCSYRGGLALATEKFNSAHFLDGAVYQSCANFIIRNISLTLLLKLTKSPEGIVAMASFYLSAQIILNAANTGYLAMQVAATSGDAPEYFEGLRVEFEATASPVTT